MSDLEFPSEDERLESVEKTDDELAEESREVNDDGIVSLQDPAGMELFLRQLKKGKDREETSNG